jgi:hypothetical protein
VGQGAGGASVGIMDCVAFQRSVKSNFFDCGASLWRGSTKIARAYHSAMDVSDGRGLETWDGMRLKGLKGMSTRGCSFCSQG